VTAAAAARINLKPYREADVRAHAFTDAVATWREVRAAVRAGAYTDQADAMAELRSARLVARLAALQWLRASTEVDAAILAEAFGNG
jgi:hypothetical protein